MEIARTFYLDRLRRFLTAPAIIAVVGLRRVGKSVLLSQFANTLRPERQVVYVDKESLEFDDIRTARNLVDYVDSRARASEPCAVIVDEVQQIDGWERAAAALNSRDHTKVIISGSNASLLAGELATLIAGRYVTLQVSRSRWASWASCIACAATTWTPMRCCNATSATEDCRGSCTPISATWS
jgi:predicted AAA+ superfamily ATPase